MSNNQRLVVGLGNEILRDDGIGIKIIADLKATPDFAQYEFKTTSVGGLEIIELISGYDEVVFIDAIKTSGGIPGDIYTFTPDRFKSTLHLSNLHDISFLTAIGLGKKLAIPIPEVIRIIAIEIIEDMEFGNTFTPEIEMKYPEILNDVKDILKSEYFHSRNL
jgi:hydrogenase maturation protease